MFKTIDKLQLSYSSSRQKILDRYAQDMGASRPQRSYPNVPSWLPPFYTSHLLLLVVPMQNRACTHDQSMKENANGHMLKAN